MFLIIFLYECICTSIRLMVILLPRVPGPKIRGFDPELLKVPNKLITISVRDSVGN